jgi:hypothetical protein
VDEVLEIEKYVTDRVKSRWDSNRRVFLLSALGLFIKDNFPDFDARSHGGLRGFCEKIETLRILRHPDSEPKIGVIPADAEVPSDIRSIFEEDENLSPGPAYKHDFWNAFIGKIDDKRFVNVINSDHIEINGERCEDAQQVFEILSSDITVVSPEMSFQEKAIATHDKINKWFLRNSIKDKSVFYHRKKTGIGLGEGRNMHDMLRAFSVLSDEDLKRINLPADIILKLSGYR